MSSHAHTEALFHHVMQRWGVGENSVVHSGVCVGVEFRPSRDSIFPRGSPGTAVPGFHVPPLRGWGVAGPQIPVKAARRLMAYATPRLMAQAIRRLMA
jgi:hypothetical protein